jgi:hypothetical protein
MTQLTRAMRLPEATSMVVGTIIGASIFVQPSEITRAVPSTTGVALVWALAGVLTLIGALICAELSSAFPRTGGVYVFLRDRIAGLFAFGGWHLVTYTAEETVMPERTIPRSLVLGVAVVTLCYVALNVIYLRVLPIERVTASTRIAADVAEALVGARGGAFVAALVIVSTFGALNGIVLAGPRVYFAMARDGVLFRWVGASSKDRRASARDPATGSLGVGAGDDRHLPRVVHQGGIHGMDLLRAAGDWRCDAAAKAILHAAVPHACSSVAVRPVRRRVHRDSDQPGGTRSHQQRHRTRRGRDWVAGVLSRAGCAECADGRREHTVILANPHGNFTGV